mgnify:CR=1 FL=1
MSSAAGNVRSVDFPDEATVLTHGFRFRPNWWTPRVSTECGGFLAELPALDRGYHRINRADLLGAPTVGLPQALVGGYVWGTGSSAFLVGRRARVFRDNEETRIANCLQSVSGQLRRGNTADAYESMLRGRANNLKHLGPSFFTKFLYAADADGAQPGRALILDRFVAVALKDLDGWDISCTGPWGPATYERWIEHAHGIAAGAGVRADAVEMAYFNHGRGLTGHRVRPVDSV